MALRIPNMSTHIDPFLTIPRTTLSDRHLLTLKRHGSRQWKDTVKAVDEYRISQAEQFLEELSASVPGHNSNAIAKDAVALSANEIESNARVHATIHELMRATTTSLATIQRPIGAHIIGGAEALLEQLDALKTFAKATLGPDGHIVLLETRLLQGKYNTLQERFEQNQTSS